MKVVRSIVSALALVLTGAVILASPVLAARGDNTYRLVGLPAYITSPTPFTVDTDGPQEICAMHFGETTLTSPPWTFTAELPEDGEDREQIQVDRCDGISDNVPVTISKAVVFRTGALFPDGLRSTSLKITNNMEQPVSVTLLSPTGDPVATFAVPGGREESEGRELHLPLEVLEHARGTHTYTLSAVGENGVVESAPLVIAKGWALFPSADASVRWKFAPCSTVTWSYDPTRQPRGARTFKQDVVEGFARLSRETGLTFVQVAQARRDAAIRIDWTDMGVDGPSGLGGTDGHVSFNIKDGWPTDLYAGFSALHGSPADRGWLIVHEFMHTLGFDHVPGRSSIMTPINYGQHQFSAGDLAGLHTVYPQAGCTPRT